VRLRFLGLSGRRPSSLPLFFILLLVAVAEVAINRVAVDALRPDKDIPGWHSALSYAGLFLYYFASTLAAGALVLRATRDRLLPRAIAIVALAVVGAFAAAQAPSDFTSFLLETIFAITVVAVVGAAVLASTDLGASIGMVLCASPLVIHYYGTIFKHSLGSPDSDLPETVQHYGVFALCIAALASPYCFAPRPLARSLARPLPLIVGLFVLTMGAMLVRMKFSWAAFLAQHVLGIDLGPGLPPSEMALYLLAIATLAWTITAARSEIALGLGLLFLGGYGFAWPLAFLLGGAGLVVLGDALPRIAEVTRTPAIDDATWQEYTTQLTTALRAKGEKVTAVTSRGEEDSQSTILVTTRRDIAIKVRLERIAGSLLCVDLVCGKDVGDTRQSALTVAGRVEGWMAAGEHPEPPPAAPPLRTGDDAFDRRFKVKGDGKALFTLFDDGIRARATASLDGWLAYWPGESLRWRMYPGMGAPLDHPVPVSDLVLKRAANADRLASVIELVAEISARGEVPKQEPES